MIDNFSRQQVASFIFGTHLFLKETNSHGHLVWEDSRKTNFAALNTNHQVPDETAQSYLGLRYPLTELVLWNITTCTYSKVPEQTIGWYGFLEDTYFNLNSSLNYRFFCFFFVFFLLFFLFQNICSYSDWQFRKSKCRLLKILPRVLSINADLCDCLILTSLCRMVFSTITLWAGPCRRCMVCF